MINILRMFHLSNKPINSIAVCEMETTDKVKVGRLVSDLILVKSSVRQGDALSPCSFNLVLEKLIREMNIDQYGFKLQELSIGC